MCSINKDPKTKSRFTKRFIQDIWNKYNINMALGKARGKYENLEKIIKLAGIDLEQISFKKGQVFENIFQFNDIKPTEELQEIIKQNKKKKKDKKSE